MKTQDLKPARRAAAPTACGEVAGGGAGERGEAEGAGGLDGDRHDAVLEGVRRVAGVVLHIQAAGDAQLGGEPVGLDELGETGVQVGLVGHVRGDRQQRGVAPDVVRTGLDLLPQALGVAARQVVGDFERPETFLAREDRAEREARAALAAGQRGGGAQSDGGGVFGDLHSHGGEALSPHLPRDESRHETDLAPSLAGSLTRAGRQRPGGKTGWRVAGASTGRIPLPLWMSGMALGRNPGVCGADPDMRRSSALFKTVTEGTDG